MNTTIKRIGAAVSLALLAAPAWADYPERPVTMVIGYEAGGGTDTIGRVIASAMAEDLGQPVTVVNRPGAGGGLATMGMMRERPDGYTILLNPSSSLTLNPQIMAALDFEPENLDYIASLADYQAALVAPASRPYDTLDEFIAWANESGRATYAPINPGSAMAMDVIAAQAGLEVRRVPVADGAGAISALMGEQVDLSYTGGIHQRYGEQIKVILPLTSERQSFVPDVPTAREQGYPVELNSSIILAAPPGTPPEIIARLEAAARAASEDGAFHEVAERMSFPVRFSGAEETTTEIRAQWEAYAQLIERSGYEPN